MTLPTKKTKPTEKLSDQKILIHGQPKIGKSTLASKFPNALFLATEPGLGALEVYQVPIRTWEELTAAFGELCAGEHNFKNIVVDTIDNAYAMCAHFICRKNDVDHEADLQYGKGYGLLNREFMRVMTKAGSLPYGLILISHSVEKEINTPIGKTDKIVPSLPGKSRELITAFCDLILYCDIQVVPDENGQPDYRRVIHTKPGPKWEAGDRTGRLPAIIDLSYENLLAAFNGRKEKTKK